MTAPNTPNRMFPSVGPAGQVLSVEGAPADGDVPTYSAATQSTSWGAGGGGGSQPLISFPFAFDTASLAAGITAWTPTVDTWLFDAFIQVDTAFDGTTPLADIGINGFQGLFNEVQDSGGGVDLATAWTVGSNGLFAATGWPRRLSQYKVSAEIQTDNAGPDLPLLVPANTPLLLWASQDGTQGGTAIGGAAGAATLKLQTTPS